MRNPGYKPASPHFVPHWRADYAALEGPTITVSGRQILLGTSSR